MHVYSIDKDIRRKVIEIIFCISIFISIIMKYLLSVPIEFIGECIKKVELLKILLQGLKYLESSGLVICVDSQNELYQIDFEGCKLFVDNNKWTD